MSGKNLNYIDIFAGCGGISLGLYKAGWRGVFAIEKDKSAFETLQFNLITNKSHFEWPIWLPIKPHNINNILKEFKNELTNLQGKILLVVGGPPCQGFSVAGLRKKDDIRNTLIDSYLDFIKLVKPKALFFENVFSFANTDRPLNKIENETYSEYVVRKLNKLGYNVDSKLIDFSEYGIPQRRKRYILVGIMDGKASDFFDIISENRDLFFCQNNIKIPVTLKDALSDIERIHGTINCPDSINFTSGLYGTPSSRYQILLRKCCSKHIPDSHRFPRHGKDTINKFQYFLKHASKNKNISNSIKDKFKSRKRNIVILDANQACPTLTTLPDDYIHYSEPRILTVREYARIQSFDDWFEFKGNYTTGGKRRCQEVPRYSQIGNAIPPLFGEQVGLSFIQILSGKSNE